MFTSSNCERRVRKKVAYFTNKAYPRNDVEPYQCLLNIKPLQDMCWVKNKYVNLKPGEPASTIFFSRYALISKHLILVSVVPVFALITI